MSVYISPDWPQIKFGLYVLGEVTSVPCYLFLLYHLLRTKVARKALHNHAIVIVLLYNFALLTLDLPMRMNFTRQGFVTPMIPFYCRLAQFVDYGIWYGANFVMVWISIERHILIFYSNLLTTVRARFLFHYIPLAFFSLYGPIFYFYLLFIYPCEQIYITTDPLCGGPCFDRSTLSPWLYLYMSLVHNISPIILIMMFDAVLLLRVIVQKRRLQQAYRWRQHRKMIIQFVFIAAVYLTCDLPWTITYLAHALGFVSFGADIYGYIFEMTNVPPILLSYTIVVTLPELKQKLHALIICKRNRRIIAPIIQAP